MTSKQHKNLLVSAFTTKNYAYLSTITLFKSFLFNENLLKVN